MFVLRAVNGSSLRLSSMLNRVLGVLVSAKVSLGSRGGIASEDVLRQTFVASGAVDPLLEDGKAGASCGRDGGGRYGRCGGRDGGTVDLGEDILGDLVGDRDGDGVGNEEVGGSERDSNEELGDLHGGESALDALWHTDTERCNGVVCVLRPS